MMRRFTKQRELLRLAKTQFATKGKTIANIVLMPSFWNTIVFCLKVSGSLVRVLRLVDGEKKAHMGYIYEAMNRAKDTIVKSFNGNEEKYKEIFNIIDKRLTRDPAKQEKVVAEVSLYTNAQGLFENELVVRTRKTRALASAPNLQRFAMKFIYLTCSASVCEQNWNIFENIHSKRKNRATGAEEARFDTRASARANSNIIPPMRKIASSFRILPSHSLIDEDEDGDMVDSADEEDGVDYQCDDDDDDFVDLEEE
ncbi:hypothetical protein AAG906_040619 [Vitis piasezkii]